MSDIHTIFENLNNSQESLNILRDVNSRNKLKKFHEWTHILYGIRTIMGSDIKTYMEIGSYIGSSASLVLRNPFPTNLICIDPCNLPPSHYGGTKSQDETLLHNIKNNNIHNYNIKLCKKYSNDTILLKQFNDTNTKVDILFIDGAHDYNGVVNDWRNYNGFVNSGGYIIFDDYNDHKYSPEVKHAVDEIVKHIDPVVYEIIGSPLNTLDDVSVGYNNTYGLKYSNEFILRKK
jgi:predicted O-methyltransferase YrrM